MTSLLMFFEKFPLFFTGLVGVERDAIDQPAEEGEYRNSLDFDLMPAPD